jgi:hypothetical protein
MARTKFYLNQDANDPSRARVRNFWSAVNEDSQVFTSGDVLDVELHFLTENTGRDAHQSPYRYTSATGATISMIVSGTTINVGTLSSFSAVTYSTTTLTASAGVYRLQVADEAIGGGVILTTAYTFAIGATTQVATVQSELIPFDAGAGEVEGAMEKSRTFTVNSLNYASTNLGASVVKSSGNDWSISPKVDVVSATWVGGATAPGLVVATITLTKDSIQTPTPVHGMLTISTTSAGIALGGASTTTVGVEIVKIQDGATQTSFAVSNATLRA